MFGFLQQLVYEEGKKGLRELPSAKGSQRLRCDQNFWRNQRHGSNQPSPTTEIEDKARKWSEKTMLCQRMLL